jgi:hypothetical protein
MPPPPTSRATVAADLGVVVAPAMLREEESACERESTRACGRGRERERETKRERVSGEWGEKA